MAKAQQTPEEKAAAEAQERANLAAAAEGNPPPDGDTQPADVSKAAASTADMHADLERLRAELAEKDRALLAARGDADAADAERRRAAQAEARAALSEARMDETVPGGRYLVGGVWVNAHNQPLPE